MDEEGRSKDRAGRRAAKACTSERTPGTAPGQRWNKDQAAVSVDQPNVAQTPYGD